MKNKSNPLIIKPTITFPQIMKYIDITFIINRCYLDILFNHYKTRKIALLRQFTGFIKVGRLHKWRRIIQCQT